MLLLQQNLITETNFREYIEALNTFSSAMNETDNVLYTVGQDIKGNRTSLTKTVTYESDTSKKRASIVVRPQDVPKHDQKKYDQGQARIGFLFSTSKENKIRVSIDFDEYGISLDMGSRGDVVSEGLKQIGKSHHTQSHFEEGLETPEYFGSVMKQIPESFDWKFHF